MVPTGIASYLGTDVVPQILDDAKNVAGYDPRFRFEIVNGPEIPANPHSVDIVCGFSLITHLLDEEAFRLFKLTDRVLKPGGVATYSWLSFVEHRNIFLHNDRTYESRPDILKFYWPGTLEQFAEDANLEVIETIRATQDLNVVGDRTMLNGEISPISFKFGQCLISLRKKL